MNQGKKKGETEWKNESEHKKKDKQNGRMSHSKIRKRSRLKE